MFFVYLSGRINPLSLVEIVLSIVEQIPGTLYNIYCPLIIIVAYASTSLAQSYMYCPIIN